MEKPSSIRMLLASRSTRDPTKAMSTISMMTDNSIFKPASLLMKNPITSTVHSQTNAPVTINRTIQALIDT